MQLTGIDPIVTQNISEEIDELTEDIKTAVFPKDVDSWASIHLVDSGQILPLADRSEFTLGRVSEAQPIMPDIDLTPYQAYASGVSRLHAVIKREREQVFVMDLGSSNGTYVNGKRLKPNTKQLLNHGNMLSLGKLKIQVLLENA
jgi:predicted component of type VI protein secretion system